MDGCLITGGLEPTLNRTIYKNNDVFFSIKDGSGAPIFEESTISNTIFANNRANEDGHSYEYAVEILSKNHRLKLDNVLVANNDFEERVILASTYTGTTRITTYNFTNLSIINNEIENDDGIITNGEGGLSYPQNVVLSNSLFVGNTSGDNTARDYVTHGSNPGTSLTGGFNATDYTNSVLLTDSALGTNAIDLGTTSIPLANLFVDPEDPDGPDDQWFTNDDGFVPSETSVLKDSGDNEAAAYLSKDLRGVDRTQNETVDIGAYEFGTSQEALSKGIEGLSHWTLYPNPAPANNKGVEVTLPNDGEVHRVIVRDMLGRLIKNVEPDPSHTKVNLGSLAKGSYLIFLVRRDNSNYQPYQLLVE